MLVFAPHPDDEVLGAGALLHALKERGCRTGIVYLTSGSDPDMMERREKEASLVCERLEAGPVFLRLRRREKGEWKRGLERLTGILNSLRPDMVVMPQRRDAHPTHRFSHRLISEALNRTLFTGTIMEYGVWSPVASPGFFLCFDEEGMRRKEGLFSLYSSQLERSQFHHAFRGMNRYYGVLSPELSQRGVERWGKGDYAEAFRVKKEMPEGNRVLALGDIFLDVLPEPIERTEREGSTSTSIRFSPGGNAANFAIALSALGGNAALYAAVGEANTGGMEEWEWSGVNEGWGAVGRLSDGYCPVAFSEGFLGGLGVRAFLLKKSGCTATTFALTYTDGERHFVSDFGANMEFGADDLPSLSPGFLHLHRAGFFWLPGLFNGGNLQILREAKALGMTTSLDTGTPPGGKDADGEWSWEMRREVLSLLPYVDIYFANEAEIRGMSTEKDIKQGARLLLRNGAGMVVVHRGERGASLFRESQELHLPAKKIVPVNPTGSGDVFNAAFVHYFLQHRPLKECLKFAVAAGSLHTAVRERPYPAEREVREFMESSGYGERDNSEGGGEDT